MTSYTTSARKVKKVMRCNPSGKLASVSLRTSNHALNGICAECYKMLGASIFSPQGAERPTDGGRQKQSAAASLQLLPIGPLSDVAQEESELGPRQRHVHEPPLFRQLLVGQPLLRLVALQPQQGRRSGWTRSPSMTRRSDAWARCSAHAPTSRARLWARLHGGGVASSIRWLKK
eukprot:4581095-Pleurochrysis_carterae.AAC.1